MRGTYASVGIAVSTFTENKFPLWWRDYSVKLWFSVQVYEIENYSKKDLKF
jgi:hypothetical protein